MSNYYEILELDKTASDDEIRKSYRKKSLIYHPDKRTGNEEKFKKISEAYETLGDKQKRQIYDMQGQNPFMSGGFSGFGGSGEDPHEEILKMFFGGGNMFGGSPFGGGGGGGVRFSVNGMGGMGNGQRVHIFRNGQPVNIIQKPDSLNITLDINLEQAYAGAKVPVEITRSIFNLNEKCSEKEVIYIDIPMGIDNNEIITLTDKGNIKDEQKGDVKVVIKVKNKTEFQRKGMDLIYEKKITLKESLIGFSFLIKHLSGKDYTINNNTGKVVTNDHMNVIKHMGMRRAQNHPASPMVGDLIIKFKITYPEIITPEQKEAISKIL